MGQGCSHIFGWLRFWPCPWYQHCYPRVLCMRTVVQRKVKKCCKLNSAVARESQILPGPKKEKRKKEKLLKDARFCKSEGEKRQMFNILQCASGRALEVRIWGAVDFSCLHSVKVFVFVLKSIFESYFSQTEGSVINISRLSKQKQTIKLTSHKKVWK